MKRKSVVACIEKAVQCTEKAAIAATEEHRLWHLRRAAAWLEIARHRARDWAAEASGKGPVDGA